MSNDLVGEIVVIKRSGNDGARFPLRAAHCTFGRDPECDIRIQIPQVELEHAKIFCDDGKVWLQNLAKDVPTLLNSKAIATHEVSHNDIFTISQRSFRFEFPDRRKSTSRRQSSSRKTPLKSIQASPRTPKANEILDIAAKKSPQNKDSVQNDVSPKGKSILSPTKSSVTTPVQQKENTPEEHVSDKATPSILKKTASAKRSEKKRISFGPNLSPELFDKSLPPSTPLRKGRSPSRRLSEPLKKGTPGRSPRRKRCSMGTILGGIPIVEEDENVVEENQESPSEESTESSADLKTSQPTAPTPLRNAIKKGVTLRQTKKKLDTKLQMEIKDGKQLKKTKRSAPTPLKAEIKKGVQLRATKRVLSAKLQSEIRAGTKLVPLLKKSLKTPIRSQIKAGIKLKRTMKKMRTPLRKEIASGWKNLKKTNEAEDVQKMENADTPMVEAVSVKELEEPSVGSESSDVIEGALGLDRLMKTPKVIMVHDVMAEEHLGLNHLMNTPKTKSEDGTIEGNLGLQRLLKTPKEKSAPVDSPNLSSLFQETAIEQPIQEDHVKEEGSSTPKSNASKRKTPLKSIKGSPRTPAAGESLKKSITRFRRNSAAVQEEDEALFSSSLSLLELSPELAVIGQAITEQPPNVGTSSVLKKATSAKRSERKRISFGPGLSPELFDKTLPPSTPLRKGKSPSRRLSEQVHKTTPVSSKRKERYSHGTALGRMPIMEEEEDVTDVVSVDQIDLKACLPTAPTPLRGEIKKGVTLRQTKKKLDAKLQMEIKEGKELKKTKMSAPTPLKAEIKKGVTLRQTKKKLDTKLQMEIKDGKQLRKTKRSAPTPLKAEIKKGVQLRATKRILSAKLQSEIRAGTKLVPLLKKSLKTPIRSQIKAGIKLKTTMKKMGTPLKKEIASGWKNLKKANEVEVGSQVDAENNPEQLDVEMVEDADAPMVEAVSVKELEEPSVGSESSDVIEGALGLDRLLKTPKVRMVHDVMAEEHLGLNRLMNTPKTKSEDGTIEGNLGLQRLLKTPKVRMVHDVMAEEHLGLNRLMNTPKTKGDDGTIEGNLGLQRLLKTPKEKSAPVDSPNLSSLFQETAIEQPIQEDHVKEEGSSTPGNNVSEGKTPLKGSPCGPAAGCPLLKKSLNTQIRNQIKAVCPSPLEAEVNSTKELFSTDPVVDDAMLVDLKAVEDNNARPVLRAKRRLGEERAPCLTVALEIPRRLPEKIERPAKKRICRRSTPKKIAELRDLMTVENEKAEEPVTVVATASIAESVVDSVMDQNVPAVGNEDDEAKKTQQTRKSRRAAAPKAEDSEENGEKIGEEQLPTVSASEKSASEKSASENNALEANKTQNARSTRQSRRGKASKPVEAMHTEEGVEEQRAEVPDEPTPECNEAIEVKPVRQTRRGTTSTRQTRRGAASRSTQPVTVGGTASIAESVVDSVMDQNVPAVGNEDDEAKKTQQTRKGRGAAAPKAEDSEENGEKIGEEQLPTVSASENIASENIASENTASEKSVLEVKKTQNARSTRQSRRGKASKPVEAMHAVEGVGEQRAEVPDESTQECSEAKEVKPMRQTRRGTTSTRPTRRGAAARSTQPVTVVDTASIAESVVDSGMDQNVPAVGNEDDKAKKTQQTRKSRRAAAPKAEDSEENGEKIGEEQLPTVSASENTASEKSASENNALEANKTQNARSTRQSRRGKASKPVEAMHAEEGVEEQRAEVPDKPVLECNEAMEVKPVRQTRKGAASRTKRSAKVVESLDNKEPVPKVLKKEEAPSGATEANVAVVLVENMQSTRQTRRGRSAQVSASAEAEAVVAEVKAARQTRNGRSTKTSQQAEVPSSKRKRATAVEISSDAEVVKVPEPKRSRRGERTEKAPAQAEPTRGRSLRSTRATAR